MNRIDATFDALRAAGRAAFIPYVTAGDPDAEATVDIVLITIAGLLVFNVPFRGSVLVFASTCVMLPLEVPTVCLHSDPHTS